MNAIAFFDMQRYIRRLPAIGIFCIVYVIVVELFIHTGFIAVYPDAIWPAGGFGLAVLILWGWDLWPAIALGSIIAGVLAGVPLLVVVGGVLGNTLQALVGAHLLRRHNFDPRMAHLRDSFMLILVALGVTIISPTITLATIWAEVLTQTPLPQLWGVWWTSQVLSVLVVTGFIVRWSRPLYNRTPVQWLETGVVMGSLILIDFLLFWTSYSQAEGLPVVYLILIPFIWIAIRLGPRWMTFGLLFTAIIALMGVSSGNFPGTAPLTTEILDIKIFIIVLSVIFLLFVASEESRKEAAKQLQDHVGQLEYALQKISAEDRAKNEFIAVLAHELRNPLAPIVSALEMIRLQGTGATDVPALVENMYEHVRTMARLLDDLLDISRISQKKFRLQKESVDFRSVVVRSIQSVEPLLQARKHTLKVALPEEAIWLEADPVRLEQVLNNLLNNAAKYTNPGGTIELTAEIEGGELVVRVADNGIGIEQGMLVRIFEPFLQVSRSTAQSAGLGIGLSLTKRLVDMHHGSIEARSRGLGTGSEFIVRLPVNHRVQLPMPILRAQRAVRRAARFPKSTQPVHTPAPHTPGHTYRILVVDDNEAAAQGLAKLLTFRGHEVSVAYNGEAALEAAGRVGPQVIVLDIGLPGIDGYEVARRIRTGPAKNAVLIALTGYGQEDDKKKAEAAGFNYHLTKPVGLSEIEAILGKI